MNGVVMMVLTRGHILTRGKIEGGEKHPYVVGIDRFNRHRQTQAMYKNQEARWVFTGHLRGYLPQGYGAHGAVRIACL